MTHCNLIDSIAEARVYAATAECGGGTPSSITSAPGQSVLSLLPSTGGIGSKKSWANTGQALYDYFSFLQAHALSWDDVDRGEEKTLLAAYRDCSFEVAKLGCLPGAFEGLAQRALNTTRSCLSTWTTRRDGVTR